MKGGRCTGEEVRGRGEMGKGKEEEGRCEQGKEGREYKKVGEREGKNSSCSAKSHRKRFKFFGFPSTPCSS